MKINKTFELYRFQLLSKSRNIQLDLFENIETLIKNKNKFLGTILADFPEIKHKKLSTRQKIIYEKHDWHILKIGAKKKIENNKPDFDKESLDDWPHVTVIINNHPEIQTIAISINRKAFSSTQVVANLIKDAIQDQLYKYDFVMHVDAKFQKNKFWELINEYKEEIIALKFELISSDMTETSKILSLDLGKINKLTNSHKINLELNSFNGNALDINQENDNIRSLVDYAAEGGGDISIKISGLQRRKRASKFITSVKFDETSLDNPTNEILESLTKILI
ncbi:hypothetical protein [Desulfobacula phenolica]|uniref:Uncharacterized protein n=1 Tax=Desulfobacula phenolica TaxID=90732 RepID=A0A1H2DXW4_9BACT|nr:hypothetical protein [Desulfobacula phenolica]SDT87619.1 hypothetical protein SAMN04487931_102305 [Desulfobacula phenolica]